MSHEIERDGNKLVIVVSGRLDAVSAPDLEADMLAVIGDVDDVAFDLAQLDYISSAGLRVLLVAFKRKQKSGVMHVVNAHDSVADVLEASGFAEIFGVD